MSDKEEEECSTSTEAPGCIGSSASRSWRPQLNPQMFRSQEDPTVTSSLKEEVIYHRGNISACLTSPAHSSCPELFTLPPQLSIMWQLSDSTAADILMIYWSESPWAWRWTALCAAQSGKLNVKDSLFSKCAKCIETHISRNIKQGFSLEWWDSRDNRYDFVIFNSITCILTVINRQKVLL